MMILDFAFYRNRLGVQSTLVEGVSFEGGERDKHVERSVVTLWGYIGF